MKNLFYVSILSLFSISAMGSFSDFTTDGCSMFPDGKLSGTKTEWRHCCVIHDIDYWMGGEIHLKEKSDKDLKACVAHVKGRALGTTMLLGVTIGGAPSPLSWSWAYGHKKRSYKKLSTKDKKIIASKLERMIDTLILEKSVLNIDQLNLIAFKVRNEIHGLKNYLYDENVELDRLMLKVDELIL